MAPNHGFVHAKEYDIKDSNVELIGTDIDHRVKYASAATEPAWNNGIVGVEPGLFVWRIEDFQVVPVAAADVGRFYEGDSYIVLHSYRVGGKNDAMQRLGHEVFFWLGTHTSQDEAGTAAYKTVELDEFLHGAATQYRELQASPSPAFLELFPRRLTVLRGGVASGFRHVDEPTTASGLQASPLLLRIFKQPGITKDGGIVVHEVEPTWRSLDDGDVFVLDSGSDSDSVGDRTLYVWQGRGCSPMEKAKAATVAHDLLTPAHKGGVQVLAQDEGRSRVVVRLLGGGEDGVESGFHAKRPLAAGAAAGVDTETAARPQRLWRLSDASGSLSFDLVKESHSGVSRSDLDSQDVLLWDDAGREVWVWEGQGASARERAQWLKVAQAYVRLLSQEGGTAAHLTPIAKVREGYESPAFLQSLQAAC